MIRLLLPALASAQMLGPPWLERPDAESMGVAVESDGVQGFLELEVVFGEAEPLFIASDPHPLTDSVGYRWTLPGEPGAVGTYRINRPTEEPVPFRLPGPQTTARLLLVSDTEQDQGHPTAWFDLANATAAWVEAEVGPLHETVDALLVAGDLIDGWGEPTAFAGTLARDGAALTGSVPLLAVPGDKEAEEPELLGLHLPPPIDLVPWWLDVGRLRIVGLDSTEAQRTDQQIGRLQQRLEEACDGPFDAVVVAMHHACDSELFTPGENDWSCRVVERLDAFAEQCGKPAVHAFGNSHGGQRGASEDARHLWVGLGSGGGNLDLWGQEPQEPSEAIHVAIPEYGFTLLELDAQRLRVRRVGYGTHEDPVDGALRDDLVLPLDPAAPPPPALTIDGSELVATGIPDDARAVRWTTARCADGEVLDRLVLPDRDLYEGVDAMEGVDRTRRPRPSGPDDLCVSVAYRDAGFVWSPASEPLAIPATIDPPVEEPDDGCEGCGGSAAWLMGLPLIGLGRSRARRRTSGRR